MTPPIHITFRNEYHFKLYCSEQSIKAFDVSIKEVDYPSRFRLLKIIFMEGIATPYYLAIKLSEIVYHIFYLFAAEVDEQTPSHSRKVLDLAPLIALGLLLPYVLTAIRLSSTVLGLFFPWLALEGWKFAERGENLSYSLWDESFESFRTQLETERASAPITPSSAIFYLGELQTFTHLGRVSNDDVSLKTEILTPFADLLQKLAAEDFDHFCRLMCLKPAHEAPSSDQAQGSEKSQPLEEVEPSDEAQPLLEVEKDKDIPKITYITSGISPIFAHYNDFIQKNPHARKALDTKTIIQFLERLSWVQVQMLFLHFHSNLRQNILPEKGCKNRKWLKESTTDFQSLFIALRDLQATRFGFGQARFSQPSGFGCYPLD